MKGQKVYLVIEESSVDDLHELEVKPYKKEDNAVKDWGEPKGGLGEV